MFLYGERLMHFSLLLCFLLSVLTPHTIEPVENECPKNKLLDSLLSARKHAL